MFCYWRLPVIKTTTHTCKIKKNKHKLGAFCWWLVDKYKQIIIVCKSCGLAVLTGNYYQLDNVLFLNAQLIFRLVGFQFFGQVDQLQLEIIAFVQNILQFGSRETGPMRIFAFLRFTDVRSTKTRPPWPRGHLAYVPVLWPDPRSPFPQCPGAVSSQ